MEFLPFRTIVWQRSNSESTDKVRNLFRDSRDKNGSYHNLQIVKNTALKLHGSHPVGRARINPRNKEIILI